MLRDGQGPVGDDEQTGRRTLRRLGPEDLREGDVLRQRLVEKAAEQHRVAVRAAQGHRLRREAGFAALTLVAPEEIGFQAALAGGGAGRFVEVDARHQQRRDGVHEGGFSTADVAGEQRIVPAQIETPNLLMKRAPVEHFHAMQAEPRTQGRRGGRAGRVESGEQGFTLLHARPSGRHRPGLEVIFFGHAL